MSEERQYSGSLADDLELTASEAAQVKGGLLPIEPGEDWTGLVRGIAKRKKKKSQGKRFFPGGGRPV